MNASTATKKSCPKREGRFLNMNKKGMNKKIALLTMAAVMGLSVTACGGGETKETQGDSKAPAESTAQTEAAAEGGEVANKDKPLV